MSDDDRDNQDSVATNITQNMKSSSSSSGRRSPPSSGPYKTKDYGSSKHRSDDRQGGYKRSNDNNYSDDRQGGYKKYNDNNYDDRHGGSGYKKSNDNYRSGGNCKETIEIESNQVGSVIGRGGSNIKDVQGQFSVRINIDKNQNSNGKIDVSITGDSQSDIDDAIKHIRNHIDNSQQRYGQRDNGQRDSNYRSSGGDHRDRNQRSNYGGRADDGGY